MSLYSRKRCLEVFFIFAVVTPACCLTCDEVLELPSAVKLTLTQLKTMKPNEIVKCISDLSKTKLSAPESEFIWQSIKSHYNGVQNVPPEVLMVLHWVTSAVAPDEYLNMTLDDIDVIQNFGLNYELNEAQLSAIVDRVREDFAGKQPEDYTYYDLTALGYILCAFNRSEIERIHAAAYKEAALMIGKFKNCSEEILAGFATLAMQKAAFGSPKYWDKVTLKILGNVARFIPKEIMHMRHPQDIVNSTYL